MISLSLSQSMGFIISTLYSLSHSSWARRVIEGLGRYLAGRKDQPHLHNVIIGLLCNSIRTLRSLSGKLLSSWSCPNIYQNAWVTPSQGQDLAFPFVKQNEFSSVHSSNSSISLWMVAHLSGLSSTPPSFVWSALLMNMCSVPLFRSLIRN